MTVDVYNEPFSFFKINLPLSCTQVHNFLSYNGCPVKDVLIRYLSNIKDSFRDVRETF